MANLIVKAKRKNQIKKMTKEELDNEIKSIKARNKKVEDEIVGIEKSKTTTFSEHSKRVKKLKDTAAQDLQKVKDETSQLENEVAIFEDKVAKEDKTSKKQKEALAKRKNDLKEKHKIAINKEMVIEKKKYETNKASYEKELEKLRLVKKDQTEKFNESLKKLDEKQSNKRQSIDKDKERLETKKKEVESKLNSEIDELEQKKNKKIEDNLKAEEEARLKAEEEERKLAEQEQLIINEMRAELSSLYVKNDELNAKKETFGRDLENTKRRLEEEYDNLADKLDIERTSLIQNNDSLRKNLDLRKEEDARRRREEKELYKKQVDELDELVALFGGKEAISKANIGRILAEKDEEFKKKYSEFVDYLDKQYEQEKDNQQKEIEDLKYRVNLEQEQLHKRNSYLKERYENRDAEYKRLNEKLIKENNALEDKIAEIDSVLSEKITTLKGELDKLMADNEQAVEEHKVELSARLSSARQVKQEIKDKIAQEKSEVLDNTAKIDNEIIKLKDELQVAVSDFNTRKKGLIDRHNDQLNALNKELDVINEDIHKFEEEVVLKDSEEIRLNAFGKLAEKKESIIKEHNLRNQEIDAEYKDSFDKLANDNETKIAMLKEENDNRLVLLKEEFEKASNDILNENELRKAELEEAKNELERQIDELNRNHEINIENFNIKKEEILAKIQEAKDNSEIEEKEFENNRLLLENQRDETIKNLDTKYQETLEAISILDQLPLAELEEAKKNYSNKVIEHDNVLKMVENEKAKMNKEIDELISINDEEKMAAEKQLNDRIEQFNNFKSETDAEYQKFQNELALQETKLANFNKQLNEELEAIKQEHAKQLEEEKEKNAAEIVEIENAYKDKYNRLNEVYEKELQSKRDELDSNKLSYKAMMDQYKAQKAKVEYDCSTEYRNEVLKTQNITDELTKVHEENEAKRLEWAKELEDRKAEMEAELASIKGSHELVLTNKKNSMDNKIADIKSRCASLRDDIIKLETDNKLQRYELEVYVENKNEEMQSLKIDANKILNEINDKLRDLLAKERELNKVHNQRVEDIKVDIAKTMSEFVEVNKIRPFALRNQNESDEDLLLAETSEFKEKINELEEQYEEMLDYLTKKKDEALTKIEEDTHNLIAGKNDIEITFESDIKEISDSYEKLIADEKEKQERLRKHIIEVKESFAKNNTFPTDKERLENQFDETKKNLNNEYNFNNLNLDMTYNEVFNVEKDQFDSLEKEKNILSKEGEKIRESYKTIDEEIFNKKTSLEKLFYQRAKEIEEFYNRQISESRKQNKAFDRLNNDEISNIFKKSH